MSEQLRTKLPKGFHSELQNAYSDWHKDLPNSYYLTDIDVIEGNKILLGNIVYGKPLFRKWVELRKKEGLRIVIIDIKSAGKDELTWTEEQVYNFFAKVVGIPVFIVWTTIELKHFKVQNYSTGEVREMSEAEYVDFLATIKGYQIEEV